MLNSKCQGLIEMQELTVQGIERELLGWLILMGLEPRRYGEAPLISVLINQVKLNAGSFGTSTHRLIFMAIERLYRRQDPIDILLILEDLEQSGDPITLQELAEIARDTPSGLMEKVDAMARIIKAFGDLRSGFDTKEKISRRLMRFREVMDHGYSHGAVWWTEDPQWLLSNPHGEHICYVYYTE
ncbi:DnaB-like helicase N-terminal domain-containing protein [Pseudomonas sp. UM16]|uniref:DnaB-like helicase N-terminal domain-containing protein n=1 Tax=Pseudomonas sp. UM16 TaxID=3158962 RepID=UPI00398FFE9B